MTVHSQVNPARKAFVWLYENLRSIPLLRRLGRKWYQNRDIRIISGVGAGLRFNTAGMNLAYASGENEVPVQEAFASQLKNGNVFLDIGANIGFFTTIAASLVGPQGLVYAFEPVPENVAALKHNLDLNGFKHAKVFHCAVSNHAGKGELLLSDWNGGASLATAAPPPDLKGQITVDLVTIDDLLAQKVIAAPKMVKIDVEGAELEVLEGMAQTIQTCRPVIVFEIDDGNLEGFTQKQSACEAFLKNYGYHVSRLKDSYQGGDWIVGNFLALPGSQ